MLSLGTGEFRGESLTGGLEVDCNSTDVQFDKLEGLKGPVRVNASLGKVAFVGLKTDARIDGRETEIRVSMAAPVPLAIYNDGDEPIELTVPPGGFTNRCPQRQWQGDRRRRTREGGPERERATRRRPC